MTLAELADVAEVERLALRPGDALIIKVPHWMRDDEYVELSERMKQAFPDTKIVVFERGVDISVLRAEDVSMTLGWDDCDPVAVCSCGARCKGDSVNDALIAWGQHRASAHRNEGAQS